MQGVSKDTKYVMELLDKTTQQNKELKEENKELVTRLNEREIAKPQHGQSSMSAAIKNAELRKMIREKDELIVFYKEICDAKVCEVKELQQLNRLLKNGIIKPK